MSVKLNKLKKARLYVVTDLKGVDPAIYKKAERALKGGADILQIRSKTMLDADFLEVGKRLKQIAKKYKKLFVVNDRPHIAALLASDGLHLGQDDLPLREARKIVGSKMIIGKSTHSLKQARAAIQEKPDYIGVGPIYGTPTKPNYQEVGLDLVRKVSGEIKIPFVAIGGIDESNVCDVIRAGAKCVAVVRAVFAASNPEKSSKIIRNKIERACSMERK